MGLSDTFSDCSVATLAHLELPAEPQFELLPTWFQPLFSKAFSVLRSLDSGEPPRELTKEELDGYLRAHVDGRNTCPGPGLGQVLGEWAGAIYSRLPSDSESDRCAIRAQEVAELLLAWRKLVEG